MKDKRVYLVDASIYVFRAYFSIPSNFYDQSGNSVNAVYGYGNFLADFLSKKRSMVSVAFDESLTTCYRNNIYAPYKANRDLPDDNLKYQLQCCQEMTSLLGLHSLCLKDYEADDIIGTLATRFADLGTMVIVTRDKDLGQLLRPGDQLWDFASGVYTDDEGVLEKFGVTPSQIADYLALAGDAVDNIPGAPGIGGKTAAMLLSRFGTLDALFAGKDALIEEKVRGAKRFHGILEEHEADIRLYRQITGIKCDVPMKVKESDLSPGKVNKPSLRKFCQTMNFGDRLQNRLVAAANQ